MRIEYKSLKNSHLYSCFDFGQLWALFEASYTYGAGSLQDALCCEHLTLFDSCSGNHGQWLLHRSKSQLPVICSTLIHRLLRRLLGKHLPCYVALAMVTEDTKTWVRLASLSSSIGIKGFAYLHRIVSTGTGESNPVWYILTSAYCGSSIHSYCCTSLPHRLFYHHCSSCHR